MKAGIEGTPFPVLHVGLKEGETVFTQRGSMVFMQGDVDMNTSADSIRQVIVRQLTQESIFMITYRGGKGDSIVSFAPRIPGRIIPLDLLEGESVICQKGAFLAAQGGMELSMYLMKKLKPIVFGGEGLILQKLTGPGRAWFEIGGSVVEKTLAPGQKLKANVGHVSMFDPSVQYDVTTLKGAKNIMFSGEHLFLAELTGPGRVWLQTMTPQALASSLLPYYSSE